MDDELRRRDVLLASAVAGVASFAGCGAADDSPSDHTESPTEDTRTQTESASSIRVETTISDEKFTEGTTTTITITLLNEGHDATETILRVQLGDEPLLEDEITIDANTTIERELETTPEPGVYPLTVNGTEITTVVVHAAPTPTDRVIGAHYYPWYGAPGHDYRGGEWSLESPSTPELGNYTSSESEVIDQHIEWCHEASISWLNVSWWGMESTEDNRFRDDILEHPRSSELDWSVLYETAGQFESLPADMSDPHNRNRLREDFKYLAETYFSNETYKRIDGRPVLYIWIGGAFTGDVAGAFEEAVEAAGVDPYLIVDLPEDQTVDAYPIAVVADAVTTYNPWDDRADIEDVFLDSLADNYRAWDAAVDHVDLEFIPGVIPGFDDTELTHDPRDNVPLPPTPERYERAAEIAVRHADGPVLVTSFNEWYEDTQIEPSEEYGEAYLDVTADVLASGTSEPPAMERSTLLLEFDRTVPESDIAPAIENGRDLTMLVSELTVRDESGSVALTVNVGSEEDDADFLLSASAPESHEDRSWRWLSGTARSLLQTTPLPDSGEIEIVGRAAADMELSVTVDDAASGTTFVRTDHDRYLVKYE